MHKFMENIASPKTYAIFYGKDSMSLHDVEIIAKQVLRLEKK